MTEKDTTTDHPGGLYIDPEGAAIVLKAFELYATGGYSDNDIAIWMNTQPIIQKLREGRKPIGKEMVHDMLQNHTYTGRVSHSEALYFGTLGQGKKSSRGRKEWFEGRHEPIISDALMEACLAIRNDNRVERHPSGKTHTYIMKDRVYCVHCLLHNKQGRADDNCGKMRPTWIERDNYGYYRCLSHTRGCKKCGQPTIRVNSVDEQVVWFLCNLDIGGGFSRAS